MLTIKAIPFVASSARWKKQCDADMTVQHRDLAASLGTTSGDCSCAVRGQRLHSTNAHLHTHQSSSLGEMYEMIMGRSVLRIRTGQTPALMCVVQVVKTQPLHSTVFVLVVASSVTVHPPQGGTTDVMVLVHGIRGPPCLFAWLSVVDVAGQASSVGEHFVTVVVASMV